jgi:regulator of protease activity HflC (stomatin/prohibitin superfamily)
MPVVLVVVGGLLALVLLATVRSAPEWRRAVVVRRGRRRPELKGPGLFLRIPVLDRLEWLDLRTVTLSLGEDAVTRDGVPVRVDALAYFRVVEPSAAIAHDDYLTATTEVAQARLRSVLGRHTFDELVFERGRIDEILGSTMTDATSSWGVSVPVVEIREVGVPADMRQRLAARHRSGSARISFGASSSHPTERA